MPRYRSLLYLALAAGLAIATGQANAFDWVGPATGDWHNPANWSTGEVPASGSVAANIDNNPLQDTSVTANSFISIGSLTIDEGDALTATDLSADFLRTSGELVIPSSGTLRPTGPLFIAPTGAMRLEPGSAIEPIGIGHLLWNRGSLSGAGTIISRSSVQNEGLIKANSTDEPLRIVHQGGAFNSILLTNSGTVRATDGAQLRVESASSPARIVNHFGGVQGRIEAAAGSTVTLERVYLERGTLAAEGDAAAASLVEVTDSTLDGVTIEGAIEATQSTLAGHIQNAGLLQIINTAQVASNITELSGGGVVQLARPTTGGFPGQILRFDAFGGPPTNNKLINHDNTIRGRGRIDLSNGELVNHGVIESGYGEQETPGNPQRNITIDRGRITNTGILRATPGNSLTLNSSVTNFGLEGAGIIEAQMNGTVDLWDVEVVGGVIRSIVPTGEDQALPGAVVAYRSFATLEDLRLEGPIGDEQSTFAVEGRIEVDDSFETRELRIEGDTQLVGGEVIVGRTGGSLELSNDIPNDQLTTLTLDGATLRLFDGGSGGFSPLEIVNRGAIVVSADSQHLLESFHRVENAGLIHAEANAMLTLRDVVTAPGAHETAILQADEDATIRVSSLVGGSIRSAPGEGDEPFSGQVVVTGNPVESVVENVKNEGWLVLEGGTIGGVIENDGQFDMQQVNFTSTPFTEFRGEGELRLQGARIDAVSGYALVNGAGHKISGNGILDFERGVVINNGTIEGAVTVLMLSEPGGGYFEQNGTLRSTGDTRLTIQTRQALFENDGLIEAGGREGSIWIDGPTQVVNTSGSEIVVHTLLNMIDSAELRNVPGGTIRGDGRIQGGDDRNTGTPTRLVNEGLLAPGLESTSATAAMRVAMDFVQTATGRLEIEVASIPEVVFNNQHDLLIIDPTTTSGGGNATLAGEVAFDLAPDLSATLGDRIEFVRLSEGAITGQFDTITGLPALNDGLLWRTLYEASFVAIEVTLAGDFNLDGAVNAADYTLWRNTLGETGAALAADANADQTVDSLDYQIWRQHYGATSDTFLAGASVVIPEPAAGGLLLFLAVVATSVGRHRPS